MRVLFAGTPEVAIPALDAVLESSHDVVAVLTRPDAPVGRKRRLTPSPVRERAETAGIHVLTPTTLRDPAVLDQIRELSIDAAPVVAYGNLVPPAALVIPRHGWINLHFSLLPAYRGAAPAQRAIIAGEVETGATVFQLDEGLDTGPVLAHSHTRIDPDETAGSLLSRMATEGAGLLLETLNAIETGQVTPVPQNHDAATLAPKLTSAEAHIDFNQPAEAVHAHIRGMSPAPGAWAMFRDARVKILEVRSLPNHSESAETLRPGHIRVHDGHVLVGTATGPIALRILAPAGKKAMPAADWARGANLHESDLFIGAESEGQRA